MNPRCCSYCGQTLPEIRLGVKLSPLKARIFDLVQRGGSDGISRWDLFEIVFNDRNVLAKGKSNNYPTLKAHICQINDLIEDSGYRIEGRTIARLVKIS